MRQSRSLSALLGCFVVTCGGWAAAAEPVAPADGLTLQPNYNAVDNSSRRPLMALLDRQGWATPLDNAGIDVYGFLQGSYTENLSDPHQDDPFSANPAKNRIQGRMFDHHSNQLALNRFDLFVQRAVDYNAKKWDVGFLVEAQYGIDAAMMHSDGLFDYDFGSYESHADPQYQFDLTQAYVDVAVPVGNGLRVRAGKFATLIGYESCDPTTRTSIQFYSRTWILTLGIPMYQTGVLATYDFTDRLSVNAGFTRGWDQSIEDNNDGIDFLGSVNYVLNDKITLYGAASVGPQLPNDNSHYRTLLNGTVYFTPEHRGPWTFALDSIIAWEDNEVGKDGSLGFHDQTAADQVPVGGTYWAGIAAFAAYRINPNLVAKGRVEYFYDADGTRWRFPQGNASFTAAPMNDPFVAIGHQVSSVETTIGLDIVPFPHDLKDLLVRPEVRLDFADHAIFVNAENHYQVTTAVDVIYKF